MLHSLVSAGSNAQGQLASGDDEDQHIFSTCSFLGCQPGALPPGTQRVVQIACGANHTLVLLDRAESSSGTRRELWAAGDGSKQQLGPSISSSVTVFTPLDLDLAQYNLQDYSFEAVAACWQTSYVVLSSPGQSDILLSFGADDYGDLGIGGIKGKTDLAPVHVVPLDGCLAAPGAAVHVLRIQTGPHTVIAQLQVRPREGPAREELVGWGAARHGQLGEQRISPTSLKNVPYLDRPRPLRELVGSIPSFALGSNHTVALRSSGILLGLGSSTKGQLTFVPDIDDIVTVDCTWNSTFVVAGSGRKWSILSSGASNKGQLGRDLEKAARNGDNYQPGAVIFPFPHDSRELIKIVCGSEHVLCLFSSDETNGQPEVWAWGWNEHGNLGIGTTEDQFMPVQVWPPSEGSSRRAVDIAAGNGTSWIVLE